MPRNSLSGSGSLQPAYADLGYARGAFPQSERAADEVLSLPPFPEMTDDHIRSKSQPLMGVAATR